jgi:hypothetical protein
MKAMLTLPTDLQDRIFKTRAAAFKIDPGVLEEDQKMVDELVPTIPGAQAIQDRMRAQ